MYSLTHFIIRIYSYYYLIPKFSIVVFFGLKNTLYEKKIYKKIYSLNFFFFDIKTS